MQLGNIKRHMRDRHLKPRWPKDGSSGGLIDFLSYTKINWTLSSIRKINKTSTWCMLCLLVWEEHFTWNRHLACNILYQWPPYQTVKANIPRHLMQFTLAEQFTLQPFLMCILSIWTTFEVMNFLQRSH